MQDESVSQLDQLVGRLNAGDLAAREEFLLLAQGRLARLARRIFRVFRRLRRWEDSEDVLQSAVLRLLPLLASARLTSVEHFFQLAEMQIRHELIDRARHHFGRGRSRRMHELALPEEEWERQLAESTSGGPNEILGLDRWSAFHEGVEELPVFQREVVTLIYYHRLKQAEAAQLLQVSVITVKRHWCAALRKLAASVTER
jgi:RNA polymerase sigma-70 factor (ECF subfamily)